jgi:hypothetical protein
MSKKERFRSSTRGDLGFSRTVEPQGKKDKRMKERKKERKNKERFLFTS